jgi:hypothetical protein
MFRRYFAACVLVSCASLAAGCGGSDAKPALDSTIDAVYASQRRYAEQRCACDADRAFGESCDLPREPSASSRACILTVLRVDEAFAMEYLNCYVRAYDAANQCLGSANSCSASDCKSVLKLYRDQCRELPEKVEDALDDCDDRDDEPEVSTTSPSSPPQATAGASAPPRTPGIAAGSGAARGAVAGSSATLPPPAAAPPVAGRAAAPPAAAPPVAGRAAAPPPTPVNPVGGSVAPPPANVPPIAAAGSVAPPPANVPPVAAGGATAPAPALVCGTTTCPVVPGAAVQPCCVEASKTCGIRSGAANACMPAGAATPLPSAGSAAPP